MGTLDKIGLILSSILQQMLWNTAEYWKTLQKRIQNPVKHIGFSVLRNC